MLRKLIKHELRGSGRIMLPMILASLVLSVLAGFSSRGLDRLENISGAAEFGMIVMIVLFVVALAAMFVMATLLVIDRFRKNLLGDEGYLMFTLPVSVDQHLWSKMIVSTIWFALTFVAFMAAMLIMLLCNVDVFSLEIDWEFMAELWEELVRMMGSSAFMHILGYCVELLALAILGCFTACLSFYCAMAIGYSFPNGKVLKSILAFIGIEIVLSMLSGGLSSLLYYFEIDYRIASLVSDQWLPHIVFCCGIAYSLFHGALLYIPTRLLLKNKLNLP